MIKRRILFAFIMICSISTYAEAIVLPVPGSAQYQTNWCWASSAQVIVRWLGGSMNQCTLADELRIASGWGDDQCCSYGYRVLAPDHICNQGNWLFYYGFRPIEDMLSDRGIDTTGIWSLLSQNAIQTEVNAGRPFIFRRDWDGGGAHALVCHGQAGGNTYFFDPWDAQNLFQVGTYNWVVDGANHTWTRTLRTDEAPTPPIPDIKVNNMDGTYYATTSTYLNMTVRLTDGVYAGTLADWWVMGYFSGVYLHLNGSGTWTTTPSVWRNWNLMDIYSKIFSGTSGAGTYTIYFGVDLTPDGVVNDPMYYDYINIVVQ